MAHDFNTSLRRACFHGNRTLLSVGLTPANVASSSESSTIRHAAFFAANTDASHTMLVNPKARIYGPDISSLPSPVGMQARANNIGGGSMQVWNSLTSMGMLTKC